MTSPVHRFAVALVLPDAPRVALEALQRAYALPLWEPHISLHITLVAPFTTHETVTAVGDMLAAASSRAPFPVTLDGLGRFDVSEYSVLFTQVVPTEELTALADDALAKVSHLRLKRSHPFVPHVTMAEAAPRETIDDYMRRLGEETIRHSFTCDRFSLLELDESADEWRVVREFNFR